ncbi:MAG: CPBP family intramembrane metalloprotease [Alphaproteobacteria bacterium]|nr:CPBP family intramembrane metalloprotease [Alphaproteobacteria bacterium]
MAKTLLLALAGPALFLVYILLAILGLLATGHTPEAVAQLAPGYAPHVLLAVLATLAIWLSRLKPQWHTGVSTSLAHDAAIGAAAGLALAAAYILLFHKVHVWLQANWGDYVPPGSTTDALGGAAVIFFVANVLLAPWVEESLYRGILFERLCHRWATGGAALVSCIAFGALHWAGGFWYMVLTGAVAGGAFMALRLWRGNLLAPFSAHLALNLVEFAWLSGWLPLTA